MKNHQFILLLSCFVFINCKSQQFFTEKKNKANNVPLDISTTVFDTNDTVFVNLKSYKNDFVYDMKYATSDNFMNTQVYDCPECLLRLKTAKSLINASNDFKKMGYKIKLYDCYRPLDVQKKMWTIVSDPNFVANPSKGSIHNKGGAVDISLVDLTGNELDMGTKFDFFGTEASHNYTNLSENVL